MRLCQILCGSDFIAILKNDKLMIGEAPAKYYIFLDNSCLK